MSRYSLASRTVFITGAAGGIGGAAARVLHERHANVVLCDLHPSAVEDLAARLGSDRALGIGVDVTRPDQLDAAVSKAVERFGGVDVVFANAGITVDPPATIAGVDADAFERVIEVDLLGVWRTVRAALPQVIERRGHVRVTASSYSFLNGMMNAAYAMSKAGVGSLAVLCAASWPFTAPPPVSCIRAGSRRRSFARRSTEIPHQVN